MSECSSCAASRHAREVLVKKNEELRMRCELISRNRIELMSLFDRLAHSPREEGLMDLVESRMKAERDLLTGIGRLTEKTKVAEDE